MKKYLYLINCIIIFSITISSNAQKQIFDNGYQNGNPIVPYVGMADPHIFIFNGKPFLYSTRDLDSLAKGRFIMPDWHIWSTNDLLHWKHERTILPTETYMGKSTDCWATDMGWRNDKYFFYFSNKNISTGVMVSESPIGPFKDALARDRTPSAASHRAVRGHRPSGAGTPPCCGFPSSGRTATGSPGHRSRRRGRNVPGRTTPRSARRLPC